MGKIEGKRREEATEDEMVGWHHQLNGHELSKLWASTQHPLVPTVWAQHGINAALRGFQLPASPPTSTSQKEVIE